ncbi:sarcosine oxidase subunit gamma [Rhodobacterales bacterium HKCCE2091]|nr:sarcosine oxidase subunit gamma [Rhodobacterales bacterium HKCCE2091]
MTDLTPTTAFGVSAPRDERHGALTLSERTDIALATLALRAGTEPPTALPEPGEATDAAVWLAPGQWMLMAPGEAETDFAARVAATAPGCSVTEQTDGWVIVDIDGPAAAIETLRERLVNLPPSALAPGRGTRTVLHHVGIIAIRPAPDRLTIMAMRSYAGSLWHALATAADRTT